MVHYMYQTITLYNKLLGVIISCGQKPVVFVEQLQNN